MAPFGTLYTPTNFTLPRARKILGAAKLNSLELAIPPCNIAQTGRDPAFLAKFPLGKFPAFEGADDGLALVESGAIAYHLAASGPRAGQLLGDTPARRALVQQWVFFNELQLEKCLAALSYWRHGFHPFSREAEEASAGPLDTWLAHIEAHMQGRTWLVDDGAGPSLADLTVVGALAMGFGAYIDAEMRARFPALMALYQRLLEVPGLKELYTVDMVETRKPVPE